MVGAPKARIGCGLWVLLASGSALGAPRTVTIATGDCNYSELSSAAQTFASALVAQRGTEVLSSEAVLERFRPVPVSTAEELGRQLEAAQTQFYAGSYEKAAEVLRQAIADIGRLSPRAEPWPLLRRARMLEALVDKSMGKKNEANEAQKRVLRIEPLFALDADYYTPATIQAFEALRKDVQKLKKAKLTITSQPSGADVFVDGASVGKTPFGSEFPAGDYRVILASGTGLSFAREVSLTRDVALQIDVGFEGALSEKSPLCLNVGPDQAIDTALKLAALAGADNAIVLRLESRNNEPGWLGATLLEVNKGTRLRDAGIRFTGPRRNEALGELAGFVITGRTGATVVATLGAAPAPIEEALRKADAVVSPPQPEVAAPVATIAGPPAEVRSGSMSAPRITSFVLAAAGAVAACSGLIIYFTGDSDRAALAALTDDQGRLKPTTTVEQAKALQGRIDSNGTTGLIVGASGAALIAAGAAVFFLFPSPAQAPVSFGLAPSPDGLFVSTAFSF